MNAKQRRTTKRKVLVEARRMGIDAPSWMSTKRAMQLMRTEINKRAREQKRQARQPEPAR